MTTYLVIFAICALVMFGSGVKWALPLKKFVPIALTSMVLGVSISLLLFFANLTLAMVDVLLPLIMIGTYVGLILLLFFRDPERFPPSDSAVVVSPSDGTVIYIRREDADKELKCQKGSGVSALRELGDASVFRDAVWHIGISLLFTDVHVNRAPISGTVALDHHCPGKFLSLRNKDAVDFNERQTFVIQNRHLVIAVVQIASRLVRRIDPYVKLEEEVKVGQRIGMIRFGSQVDVFFPVDGVTLSEISVGDYIWAGETVLARLS